MKKLMNGAQMKFDSGGGDSFTGFDGAGGTLCDGGGA